MDFVQNEMGKFHERIFYHLISIMYVLLQRQYIQQQTTAIKEHLLEHYVHGGMMNVKMLGIYVEKPYGSLTKNLRVNI